MSLLEFSLVFGLGLVSSLHCLQMCGPIVVSYSVSMARFGVFRREMVLAHLCYNGGRIVTYAALGTAAGAVGSGIGMLGKLAGLAAAARLVAGASMIVTGVLMLRVLPRRVLVQVKPPRSIGRLLVSTRALGKFGLGLALGLLPCGLVYGALLKAVETARPLAGGLTMVAFGMGTAVTLFGMGLVSSLAGLRLGAWGNRLGGLSILAAGAILVWRGLTAGPVCHG